MNIPLQEAVEMATIRAARAVKMENNIGRIQPGYPAVFSVFDDDLLDFKVLIIK